MLSADSKLLETAFDEIFSNWGSRYVAFGLSDIYVPQKV